MNLKSAPVTILLGAVGLVLLLGIGWLALIGPTLGSIGETGEARVEAQDQADAANLQLIKLRDQAENITDTDKEAAALNAMWPATADQPGFFAQVSDAATDAGIGLEDISVLSPGVPALIGVDPAAPVATTPEAEAVPADVGDIAVQDVEVSASGTYLELSAMLANLEKMKRSFLVSGATIESGSDSASDAGDADAYTLTVTGKTFVAPPLAPSTAS